MLERLNIKTGIVLTSKAKPPLHISLHFAPFATYMNTKYIHINAQKRIREGCFEYDARNFLQSKYNWNQSTIENIEWASHSFCYKSLSTNEKQNMTRYIHHRFPSNKMMLDLIHQCPHRRLLPDSTTDNDHFLTCINSKHQKAKRLITLTPRLDKLHIPSSIRNILLHHIDNYYNIELKHNLPPITKMFVLLDCITKQIILYWGHFIKGRLSSSFHPVLNNYFRPNKLGRRFKYFLWQRNIIQLLWQLHHNAWLEYCDNMHSPIKLNTLPSSAKNNFLTLTAKYKTEAYILPKHKKMFFSCTKL